MKRTADEVVLARGTLSAVSSGRIGAVSDSSVNGQGLEFESRAPAPILHPQSAGVVPMSGTWPLSHRLTLAALREAVPTARLEVKVLLLEWNVASLIEPAELCTAELVSNAVKAVNDLHPDLRRPIAVRVSSDRVRLVIEVWDCSPKPPTKVQLDEVTEHGRGLTLVEAYSDRWDFYITPQWGGKVVWCEAKLSEAKDTWDMAYHVEQLRKRHVSEGRYEY
jgi:anti-sigma regulatory factor (Ser/Thr protein kinase)